MTFYFGSTSEIKGYKMLGEWRSLKKTNASKITDEFACQWAMMSALISLKKERYKQVVTRFLFEPTMIIALRQVRRNLNVKLET